MYIFFHINLFRIPLNKLALAVALSYNNPLNSGHGDISNLGTFHKRILKGK
jgi:hypothetical protein